MSASKQKTQTKLLIRPATRGDLESIISCIEAFVAEGKVLPRTMSELDQLLPYYVVAELNKEIVGCAVLEEYSPKLAEIRSLAVKTTFQGQGIGRQLVEALVERAKKKNILEVMAITSRDQFFQSCGFDFTLPGEKKALFFQTAPVKTHAKIHAKKESKK